MVTGYNVHTIISFKIKLYFGEDIIRIRVTRKWGDSFSIMERLRRAFGFNSEVGSILTGCVFAEVLTVVAALRVC